MTEFMFASRAAACMFTGFVLLACQKGPEASSPKTAEQPARSENPPAGVDIDALLKREATGLSEQLIKAPDASWSATVPAAGAPAAQNVDGVLMIEVPIGGQANVRCEVFQEEADPGGTISGILAGARKKVEFVRIAPSVHAVAGSPSVFIDAIYIAESERGRVAGNLKLAYHAAEPRPSLCLHDEVGYRSTFEQVSKSFFGTFKSNAPAGPKPTFVEVSKMRIEDTDVGFSVTRLFAGQGQGERTYSSKSTMLMPTSPKAMVTGDRFKIINTDAQGRLAKGVWVAAEEGELTMQITVTRSGEDKYSYEGKVRGKPVKGELEAKKGIATPLNVASMLKKKLSSGGGFSEEVLEYHPSPDDYAAVVPVTYSRDAGAAPREVQVKQGKLRGTIQVDEQGVPASGSMPVANNKTLLVSREFVGGKL